MASLPYLQKAGTSHQQLITEPVPSRDLPHLLSKESQPSTAEMAPFPAHMLFTQNNNTDKLFVYASLQLTLNCSSITLSMSPLLWNSCKHQGAGHAWVAARERRLIEEHCHEGCLVHC